MVALRQQNTISRRAMVSGVGYWSGRQVEVEFRPASAGAGITFVRHDLVTPARIPAAVAHRIESPRRTTLTCGPASVAMVEHVMAALAGLQVDNCEVWVNSEEMPGCDGSSQAFVEALELAGIVAQPAKRDVLSVEGVIRLGDERCWIEARPNPEPGMLLEVCIDYGVGSPIGRQSLSLSISPDRFRRELAASRTFMLKSEADILQQQGLGTHVRPTDLLVFDEEGPIGNQLRHPDECVRHKMLDLVGDLALAGCDLDGHFLAHCSGHRLNAEMARRLLAERECGQLRQSA